MNKLEPKGWGDYAKLFHDTYELLAPAYGYETRLDTREFDSKSKNGKLMIAVCGQVLSQVEREALERGRNEERERVLLFVEGKLRIFNIYGNKQLNKAYKIVIDFINQLNGNE